MYKIEKKNESRMRYPRLPKANHMNLLHVYTIFVEELDETSQITPNARNILHGIPIPFPV